MGLVFIPMKKTIAGNIEEHKFFDREFVIASIIVGFLFILPHLVAMFQIPNYNYFQTDHLIQDDFLYSARLQAFTNFVFSSEVANYEHRDIGKMPIEKLEQAIFLPFYLLIQNFFFAYLAILFFSGFFTTLFVSNFLKLFFRNKKAIIMITLLTLTSGTWMYYFPPPTSAALTSMLKSIFLNPEYLYASSIPAHNQGGTFLASSLFFSAKLYHQLFNWPLFFLGLYLLTKGFHENKRKLLLSAGTVFGIFAYSEFFFFVVGMATLFVFFLYALKKLEHAKIKLMIFVGLIAFAVSLPHTIDLYNFSKSPTYIDMEERLSVEYGHFFKRDLLLPKFILPAALIFVMGNGMAYALALILLGVTLSASTHMITGKIPQIFHFYDIGVVFLFISLLYLSVMLFERFVKNRINFEINVNKERTLKIAIISLIALYTAEQIHIGSTFTEGESYDTYKIKAEFFRFVKENTTQEDVFLALSVPLNYQLSSNAGKYLFLPNGFLTAASTEELEERILLAHRFCNVPEEYLENLFGKKNERHFDYFFHGKYQYNPKYGQTKYYNIEEGLDNTVPISRMPKEHREELLEKYRQLGQNAILEQNKYKVDYFVISQLEKDLNCQPGGETVFSNEMFEIVKLHT